MCTAQRVAEQVLKGGARLRVELHDGLRMHDVEGALLDLVGHRLHQNPQHRADEVGRAILHACTRSRHSSDSDMRRSMLVSWMWLGCKGGGEAAVNASVVDVAVVER